MELYTKMYRASLVAGWEASEPLFDVVCQAATMVTDATIDWADQEQAPSQALREAMAAARMLLRTVRSRTKVRRSFAQ